MPSLTICITVDWEGLFLKENNLVAMGHLRERLKDIPLTHFICPAYLTRGNATLQIVEQIKSGILPQDEIGLHVHCLKSLVQAAGVIPMEAPSWNKNEPIYNINTGGGTVQDTGHGVPLSAYSLDDIEKILKTSCKLLTDSQIAAKKPVSFRCGGWMSADPVLAALQNQGFENDSSATDAPYFVRISKILDGKGIKLGKWLGRLWGSQIQTGKPYLANTRSWSLQPQGITATTQPYKMQNLMQVPNNGTLADYVSQDMIHARFRQAWEAASEKDTTHVCGFHQESATFRNIYDETTVNIANFYRALVRFVDEINDEADQDRTLLFGTIASVSRRPGIRCDIDLPPIDESVHRGLGGRPPEPWSQETRRSYG